MKLSLNT